MRDNKYLRVLRGRDELEKTAFIDSQDVKTGAGAGAIAAGLGAAKAHAMNKAHQKKSIFTRPISKIFSKKVMSKRTAAGRAGAAGALLGVGWSKFKKRGQ